MNRMNDYLYSRLPSVYRVYDEKKELKRFLEVLEGGLNFQIDETSNLMDLIDIDKCPDEYIPFLCNTLGVVYEPSIPIKYQRRFLKNAVALNKRKGTISALKYLTRELAGNEAEVEVTGDNVDVYIIKAKTGKDTVVNSEVERRNIENYLKYYIPVMFKLAVYLYFGSDPIHIEIEGRVYKFNVPYKICNRFNTAEVKGGLLAKEVALTAKAYFNDVLYPICNTFITSQITMENVKNNVILTNEYKDNDVLFKRVGSVNVGEEDI